MKISFLTSCMNRTHHLKQTYLKNIENSITNKCEVEFVLLNYNSTDDLDDFVKNELRDVNVELKYIKTNKPKYFNMSHAKNTLGKSSSGNLLCWLDADNRTQKGFIEFVLNEFSENENSVLRVEYSSETAGMCGRVVCSKQNFNMVRGYNEKFKGWGYEEIDFCERLKKLRCKLKNIPLKFLGKIEHTEHERMCNYSEHEKLEIQNTKFSSMKYQSNYNNFVTSLENIKNKKYIANLTNSWGDL